MPITQILLTAGQTTTYTLTPDYYNPNEGIALNFTVGGSGISNGTYYWDITNSGTTNDDFTVISGSVTVTNNSGSFTITPTADGTTEGNETFIVALRNGAGTILASSGTITIQPVTPIMSLIADDYAGSGTTWADSSGLGSTGTLVNTPTFANTSPKHFTFDRTSLEYVQGPVLGNLPRWTMESWFRISEPLSNMPTTALITTTYQESGGNLYGVINYTFSNYSSVDNSALTLGFFNNGTWYNTSGFVPTVDTWYHVVGTYDGTTLKQYVNGTLDTTRTVTTTPTANGGPVRIGRRWDGAAEAQHYFSGDIATAKIYNGALTATEVAAAYNSSKSAYATTYTLTPAANNVNEGDSLTFTVGGNNIIDGTYYWAMDTNEIDFTTANGSVTVTSSSGTFSITPNADVRTDGVKTTTVTLRSGSVSGNILANSTVTINDTSLTPVVAGSLYFDNATGSSKYLTVGSSGAFDQDVDSVTVECWVNVTSGITNTGWLYGQNTAGFFSLVSYADGTFAIVQDGSPLVQSDPFSAGSWHHVAMCLNYPDGTLALYVDGVSYGSNYMTGNTNSQNPIAIGAIDDSGGYPFIGYISDFRVTKALVYTGNFSTPSVPLTAISGTQLLLNTASPDYFVDSSTNGLTVTNNNGVTTSTDNPF